MGAVPGGVYPRVCPRCGREAPIVYRGVVPSCTACGAVRAPLSGPSHQSRGKAARGWAGHSRISGVLVLVLGGAFALAVWLLAFALSTPGVALGLSLPFALASLVFGALLLGGGRRLGRAGRRPKREMREQALLALAARAWRNHGNGWPRACSERASATPTRSSTGIAKREPDRIAVDVDDQGVVWFRPFGMRIGSVPGPFAGADGRAGGGVRIDVNGSGERGEQRSQRDDGARRRGEGRERSRVTVSGAAGAARKFERLCACSTKSSTRAPRARR